MKQTVTVIVNCDVTGALLLAAIGCEQLMVRHQLRPCIASGRALC